MTEGRGVEKSVSQEQFTDTFEKLSASITTSATASAANVKALHDSLEASIAKNDGWFDQLWEKVGDQAELIARVAETSEKLDTFFIDKYLHKKDIECEGVNPPTEGALGAKVPTMKPAGMIVVKVIPPSNEGDGGNQFEQVNELAVQAGAQPLAANVVAQLAATNGIVWPKDIQGIYDRALQQLRAEFKIVEGAWGEPYLPESIPKLCGRC
ncbi:hypothetical protein ACLB2K_038020 [Fragaria x ananassa]